MAPADVPPTRVMPRQHAALLQLLQGPAVGNAPDAAAFHHQVAVARA